MGCGCSSSWDRLRVSGDGGPGRSFAGVADLSLRPGHLDWRGRPDNRGTDFRGDVARPGNDATPAGGRRGWRGEVPGDGFERVRVPRRGLGDRRTGYAVLSTESEVLSTRCL